MTWISLILAILQLVNKLMEYGLQQKWIAEGEAKMAAKAAAEIVRKSSYAKATAEEIADLSDGQLDDLLRWLESGETGSQRG